MHRIGNTNAINPNWGALVPDDGPVYSLEVQNVKTNQASIEARANVDCTLTYTNKVVESSDTPTPDSVLVSKNQPVIVELNDLIEETEYHFEGLFTPTDTTIESGSRAVFYTTTSTMQVVPQPAATPPNVGIVALPMLGKESVQLLLNVSCSRRGVAEMRVFNETAGGPIKNLAITNEADTGNAPPLHHFIAGFTADGFQLVTGLQPSTDYTIFVVKLYGEDGEAFDSDVSIEYRTADVDVTNELSIQVALDDQVGEDGSRPGETSFSLQMEVTQDSSCSYFVTDPGNNEAIVLDGNVSVSGGNSASVSVTGLTPNTLYNCSVVALSDYPTTQKQISVTTLPAPLEIDAYLTTPAENGGTSLVANFVVSRSSSVLLTLTAEGESYSQEVQEGTQSFVFQGLTPSTLYTLTALATADSDGSEASATDTRSTLAPPTAMLISVDLVSSVNETRPPVSGSAPTADGHIEPFEGDYGAWNAILTTGGQALYEKNNLLNGSQEETSIGVVVNSNSAQHYTFGFYDGDTKTNVGEDIIGLAMAQNTGTLIEGYFTGLDDSKRYSVRMFGQHVNQSGVGSVNFAKFGVNGDKKDTSPTTATCTWYTVAPSGGRINLSLEYVNPSATNEFASLGGFQLREEVS